MAKGKSLILIKFLLIIYSSFSEIGYLVMGRPAIFIVNFIVFFASFMLIMLYLIIFSGIASSLV